MRRARRFCTVFFLAAALACAAVPRLISVEPYAAARTDHVLIRPDRSHANNINPANSPWQKSCRSEKWGLPPIRLRHSPRNKVLSLKRIGWLYPIFRHEYFHHGLLAVDSREGAVLSLVNGAASVPGSCE